jgi:hypothetical protein
MLQSFTNAVPIDQAGQLNAAAQRDRFTFAPTQMPDTLTACFIASKATTRTHTMTVTCPTDPRLRHTTRLKDTKNLAGRKRQRSVADGTSSPQSPR